MLNQFYYPLFLTLFLFPFFTNAQLNWSDPVTWPSGTVPANGEAVIIPMGTHILLDENTADLAGLTIHGTLEFDDQDLELTADWIMVMGLLEVGTEAAPYTYQAVITLNAQDTTVNNMGMGTRGIMVMGGRLDLHGMAPDYIWSKLDADAPSGSNVLSTTDTTGWQMDDEIIIAPTDYFEAGFGTSVTQKTHLTNINNDSITIADGLNAYRWGSLQYATTSGMSLSDSNTVTPPSDTAFTPTILDERAYIGHLTRNILVQAPDDALWNNDGFGFHIMVMRDGNGTGTLGEAYVEGVELRRGGQRGLLGRYPFHWHMLSYNNTTELGDATGQYIRNSSVQESMNRGIVIHGTNGTLVQNNIVYDVRGHGIFTEDASERRNVIDGNLVLHVRNPDPGFALKNHEAGVFAGRGSSGFWLSNPDNTIINNVSGDCQTNGFWLAYPSQTFGLSAGIDIIPNRLLFGVFESNTAFSNAFEGIILDVAEQDIQGNVFPQQYISTTDGQEPSWPYPTVRRFATSKCQVWKNAFHGFWDRSAAPDTYEFVSADNCGRYFAGSGAEGVIKRCLVVGTSLNHLMNGTDRPNLHGEVHPAAFATYHSAFDIVENIAINFPVVPDEMSGVFATNDYYLRPVEIGQIRNEGNLIVNSHPGVKLTSTFPYFVLAGALWDPHGMWGSTPGKYLVYDDSFFTYNQVPDTIAPIVGSGGVLVDGPFYGFNEFVINEGNIRWEDYMEIKVDRLNVDFDTVGTWIVEEAQAGWQLAHMRHFATHPDSYYDLEFPNIAEVTDVGITVTNIKEETDFQILVIEYSGNYSIDQIYTSVSFNYFDVAAQPASNFKHIYEPVAQLEDLLNSNSGGKYWQDPANNRVWIKIKGGIDQFWSSGEYEPDSDEELLWPFYLRIMGSPGTPNQVDLFADDTGLTLMPNPTNDIFEIRGNNLSDYTLQILDAAGNIHQTLNPTGNYIEVDITALPAGLFFIYAENNGNSLMRVRKILKM